jgi:hypothetical protein
MGSMNQPFKNILRIGGVIAGLGAAVWALRDKLLPAPEIPDGPPPRFRTGTGASAGSASSAPPAGKQSDTTDAPDLTVVKGIGPVYADRLEEAGITTFAELASADVDAVCEAAKVSKSTATSWMEQAATLS